MFQRIYPVRPPTPVFRPGVSLDAIPGLQATSCSNGDSSSSDCSCGSLQHVGTKYTNQYYFQFMKLNLIVTARQQLAMPCISSLAVWEGHEMPLNVTLFNDLNGSTYAHPT